MTVVSGWAPVSTVLSKAAAVLRPGMVLLAVLVPAMLSRADPALIHSLLRLCSHSFIRSLANWFTHSLVPVSTVSFSQRQFPHSFIPVSTIPFFHSLIHPFPYLLTPVCNRWLPMGSGMYSP